MQHRLQLLHLSPKKIMMILTMKSLSAKRIRLPLRITMRSRLLAATKSLMSKEPRWQRVPRVLEVLSQRAERAGVNSYMSPRADYPIMTMKQWLPRVRQ
jgi:hypothetical protein